MSIVDYKRKQQPQSVGTAPPAAAGPLRGELESVLPDGRLAVRQANGSSLHCEWLDNGALPQPALAAGDRVLYLPSDGDAPGVVLGRLALYRPDQVPAVLNLQASESLTLRCGQSSVDLRADGQLAIRGDDVLVRAKGAQRIRAGSVSIN